MAARDIGCRRGGRHCRPFCTAGWRRRRIKLDGRAGCAGRAGSGPDPTMTKAQKPSGRVHIETEPLAAISLSGPSTKRASARWGAILVWFMRLVSAVWLLQGLVQWHTIILPGPVNFDALPPTVIGVTIFFAVIDPAAAVGLWLATPWGGVIWLLAVVAQ